MAIRPIDGDELLGITRLLDTDVVRQSKTASWLLDQVLHDIQAMPTLAPESLRPRWIPVTERLPVEAKKVLCFLALSGGPMVETGYYMGDELWYYTGIEAPHHGIVTHWMPLPEPPEVSE